MKTYIPIDVDTLAEELAREEFKAKYEDFAVFGAIYERLEKEFGPDEFYMNSKYQDIFDNLIDKIKNNILFHSKPE